MELKLTISEKKLIACEKKRTASMQLGDKLVWALASILYVLSAASAPVLGEAAITEQPLTLSAGGTVAIQGKGEAG